MENYRIYTGGEGRGEGRLQHVFCGRTGDEAGALELKEQTK